MNNQLSKQLLIETPETKVKVSAALHRDIMRAVRLARPQGSTASSAWAIPAWGVGAVALAFGIVQLVPTAPEGLAKPVTVPVAVADTQNTSSATPLMILGNKLAVLSEQSLLPEKELREELERLKSDLERFGLRS